MAHSNNSTNPIALEVEGVMSLLDNNLLTDYNEAVLKELQRKRVISRFLLNSISKKYKQDREAFAKDFPGESYENLVKEVNAFARNEFFERSQTVSLLQLPYDEIVTKMRNYQEYPHELCKEALRAYINFAYSDSDTLENDLLDDDNIREVYDVYDCSEDTRPPIDPYTVALNGSLTQIPELSDLIPEIPELDHLGGFRIGTGVAEKKAGYLLKLLAAKMRSEDMKPGLIKVFKPSYLHLIKLLGQGLPSDPEARKALNNEKATTLFKIAEALGNCNTPLRDLLYKVAQEMTSDQGRKISDDQLQILSDKTELQSTLLRRLKDAGIPLLGDEIIEKATVFFTALYRNQDLPDNLENGLNRIVGAPKLSFPLSSHSFYAKDITPEQVQVFLMMVCKTKTIYEKDGDDYKRKEILATDFNGNYMYAASKVKSLTAGASINVAEESFDFTEDFIKVFKEKKYSEFYCSDSQYGYDLINPKIQHAKFLQALIDEGIDLADRSAVENYFKLYKSEYLIPTLERALKEETYIKKITRSSEEFIDELPIPTYKTTTQVSVEGSDQLDFGIPTARSRVEILETEQANSPRGLVNSQQEGSQLSISEISSTASTPDRNRIRR